MDLRLSSSRLCYFFLIDTGWDNLEFDATQSSESQICGHVEVTCILFFLLD